MAQRDRARVTRIKRMNRNAARQRGEPERGAECAQQRPMRLRPPVERLVDGGEGRRCARIVLARKDIFQHVETDRPGAEQERRRVGEGFFQGDRRKEQHNADQRVDGERPAREHARREDLIRLRRMQPIDEALRCADRACVKLHKPHGQCAEHEREHGVRELIGGERDAAEQHRERGRVPSALSSGRFRSAQVSTDFQNAVGFIVMVRRIHICRAAQARGSPLSSRVTAAAPAPPETASCRARR